jgi:hypothetical protein
MLLTKNDVAHPWDVVNPKDRVGIIADIPPRMKLARAAHETDTWLASRPPCIPPVTTR